MVKQKSLVHPVLLKCCKLMWRQEDICFSPGGDHLKSDRKKMMLRLCLPQQHCQEFSKYCSKKVTAEGKDFYYFPEQTAVRDPYNLIQRLLSIIKFRKLCSQKGEAIKGTPSIHGGGDGPGIWNPAYRFEPLLWETKRTNHSSRSILVYVYIYIYIHTHPHMCTHTYTQIKDTHLHTFVYVYIHTYGVSVCIYVCIYKDIYIYMYKPPSGIGFHLSASEKSPDPYFQE